MSYNVTTEHRNEDGEQHTETIVQDTTTGDEYRFDVEDVGTDVESYHYQGESEPPADVLEAIPGADAPSTSTEETTDEASSGESEQS